MLEQDKKPEFSRLVTLANIKRKPIAYSLTAEAQERSALAKRFNLAELSQLDGELSVTNDVQGIRVKGQLRGRGQQFCCVTGAPVDFKIAEEVNTLFVSPERFKEVCEADPYGLEDDEDYEEIVSDSIDLGELVAQLLAVALDPYPRAQGVEDAPENVQIQPNPFAVLTKLKEKG